MVIGIDRPALAGALADRGLTIGDTAAAVALLRDGVAALACPTIIEAQSAIRAARLLDDGADDVVLASDPDSVVAARLASLIRRSRPVPLTVGDLAIDTVERRVMRHGRPLPLLPREYALFHVLARHAGKAVDRATLYQALWGRVCDPGTNVIAVHVSRLRAKLGTGGVTVVTDRGKGYRLVAPVAARGQRG